MRIHALEPQIHPLDFHSVREIYPLKSIVRRENTLEKSVLWVTMSTDFHRGEQSNMNNAMLHIVEATLEQTVRSCEGTAKETVPAPFICCGTRQMPTGPIFTSKNWHMLVL